MGFFTSDRFASASADGTDWRDTSRKVLESLEKARTENDNFNIGFLYISDSLVDDAESILNLFKSVCRIEHWVGGTGLGVCGTGEEYVDGPAITAMIGRVGEDDFCIFPPLDNEEDSRALDAWTSAQDPMLVLVHGDPMASTDPMIALAQLEQITGGFIVGGMSSSRGAHIQFSDLISRGGMCGVAFSQSIEAATALTQGCAPLGPVHTITRCDDHVIFELDGQRAFDVFSADLQEMAKDKSARDVVSSIHGEDGELGAGAFQGEVHVAFPVSGTDQKDYLVRNAIGIDPEKGWIAVAHNVSNGEQMMFVHRDNDTVRADLSRTLLDLRERVKSDKGGFNPKGAIYISCVARTMSDFGDGPGGEMKLVREIIGDVPLVGFYANGEISNRRLYGYTAIMVLFL